MNSSLDVIINQYIESFIYSFEAAYDSSHEEIEGVKIFYYGQKFSLSPYEVVPFQSIVFANDKPAQEISIIARNYKFQGDGSYAIQVFHEEMNPHKSKLNYQPYGYEYSFPGLLQMIDLHGEYTSTGMNIKQAKHASDADHINSFFMTSNLSLRN